MKSKKKKTKAHIWFTHNQNYCYIPGFTVFKANNLAYF